MLIYHYDANNEYTGTSKARLDLLETDKKGEDVHLLPANSTIVAPNVLQDNQVNVFNGSGWDIVSDFRGTDYWDSDGNKTTIDTIGNTVPAGMSLFPVESLEDKKQVILSKAEKDIDGILTLAEQIAALADAIDLLDGKNKGKPDNPVKELKLRQDRDAIRAIRDKAASDIAAL